MYTAHVEATFESAHANGPAGHKCAGTQPGIPGNVAAAIMDALHDIAAPSPRRIYEAIAERIGNGMLDYHGHSWLAELDFAYDEDQLDESGWGPDFGAAKELIRQLDHHNLNLLMDQPSAERIAEWLYGAFMTRFGFAPLRVVVHEGRGNRMVFEDPADA